VNTSGTAGTLYVQRGRAATSGVCERRGPKDYESRSTVPSGIGKLLLSKKPLPGHPGRNEKKEEVCA